MTMRFVPLLFLVSSLGFAGSWTGYLVDSNCYATVESNRNINPTSVDRDMNAEIRRCSANEHTRTFVVVLSDWLSVKFDAAGNAKAAELVRQSPKGSEMRVEVTGNREKDKMKVSWISAAP
jgi:hypothetical protein